MDAAEHLHVSTEHEGRVVVLELNHGKANEIGYEQLAELERLAVRLESDPRAVALISFSRRKTSKGTPIFVAGANVTERAGWPDERVVSHVKWQREVLTRLRRVPQFHVVAVEGVALGWGTEFLLTGDYRIACDSATFGLPETGLGILPGAGGTSELWAQIGVAQTLRLGMTGERIDAAEALRIGLVQERTTSLEVALARARTLAESVAKRSPTALGMFKRGVLAAIGEGGEERARIEQAAYVACVEAGDAAIGRAAFETIRGGGTPAWGPRKLGRT